MVTLMQDKAFIPATYNGLVETSMRLLIILESQQGKGATYDQLRLMDFFAVFSSDVDGPSSVHQLQTGRGGAYRVRPKIISDAIQFLLASGLIYCQRESYRSSYDDDGEPYSTPYLRGIQSAAIWMNENRTSRGDTAFFSTLKKIAMSLMEESLSAEPPTDTLVRFNSLAQAYAFDIERMHGLTDACLVFQNLLSLDHKTAANDNGHLVPPLSYFDAVRLAAERELNALKPKVSGLQATIQSLPTVAT